MKKSSLKNHILLGFSASLLLSITLFFFGPLEIMLSSPAEFWFRISDVILLIAGSTIVCFVVSMFVMFIAARFGEKILNIVISLIAAIGMAFYIQGNWTFVNYGEMDGTAINWGNYHNWAIIDSLIWIIIIAVLFFLINYKPQYSKIYSFLFLGIVGIESITLGTLSFSLMNTESKVNHTLTGEGTFQLSGSNENIIVICADGFDGTDFLPALKAEPELKDAFDGFTFYRDTAGTSLFSEESGITLLTGNQFEVGLTFNDNVKKAYEESELYDTLQENNYRTYIYTQKEKMVSPDMVNQIENFEEYGADIKSMSETFRYIYKMVAFRYMPHVLKEPFWYSSMDFANLKEVGDSVLYYNYDVMDYLKTQGISTTETDHNIYQFFWIQGPHEPANTDRYCRKVSDIVEMESNEYSDKQFEQTIGVVRLFTEVIHQLKSAGIYDNTTIVFTADHGWDIRPNPLFLVKPKNTHGKLEISDVPVSMIEDYASTLQYFITGDKKYGNTIYEWNEKQARKRPIYIYDINKSDRTYNSRREFYYEEGDFSTEVVLGEKMSPSNIAYHAVKGFSTSEATHIWTDGSEAELSLDIQESFENIKVDMSYMTYNGEQSVEVYANNTLVTKFKANGKEEKSFIIPGDVVANNKLNLKFLLPDAVAPCDVNPNSSDDRIVALGFYDICLSDTETISEGNTP